MSAKRHQIVDRLTEQLGGFEDQLRVAGTGAEVLGDIKESIGALVTMDRDNESVVRRMLQQHLEQGILRKNSFRVAVSILDQALTDNAETSRQAANEPDAAETSPGKKRRLVKSAPKADLPSFDSTVVIPNEAIAKMRRRKKARPGIVLNDRFVLDKAISSDSIGTLHLAFDQDVEALHRDETRVAITVLTPDIAGNEKALTTLQKISRKARRLAHPHIVHFIDLRRDGRVLYFAKEWIEGRSLADILDSSDARRIDRVAAFRIVSELGLALDYSHRCGIVHADVKPGNIMIAQDGCARLVDSVTARAKLLRQRASSEQAAGSTTYASRQVLLGERLSATDDVFSLACLLYRLVAGHRVFGPRNAAEAFAAGMQPERPAGLNDSQWHALERALRHEREDRFESIPEFMTALEEGDSRATSIEPLALVNDKSRRGPVSGLIAGLCASALVIAGLYMSGMLTMNSFDDAASQSGGIAALADNTRSASPQPGEVPRQTVLVSQAAQGPLTEITIDAAVPAAIAALQLPTDASPAATAEFSGRTAGGVSKLPVNAVGFADEFVVIRESDTAVQIDVTRFNPDQQRFSIGYFVNDITAKEGEDYFAPESYSIPFGPGQHTARLLIPLVHDTVTEGDETFVIRLMENDIAAAVVEAQSVVVTIRDDAPQSP